MTICIAAIAERKFAVIAADRTLTLTLQPEEFAHGHQSKVYEVTPTFVVASAGTPVYVPEFLSILRGLSAKEKDRFELLSESLRILRRKAMERSILHRFGWTYDEYEGLLSKGQITEAQARIIGEEMDGFHVCLHVVAGTVGTHSAASIFSAEDCGMSPMGRMPKSVFCHDSIGWVTSGSGAAYAEQALVRANCYGDRPLAEVIYDVFEAKKNAEQAIGVGRETDLRVVTSGGTHSVSDRVLRDLARALDASKARHQKLRNRALTEAQSIAEESVKAVATLERAAGGPRRSGRGSKD